MLHLKTSLLFLILSSPCFALSSDKDAPVEIAADSADINQATGTTVYQGDVRIAQGSMELTADKITIKYHNRKPHKLIATGTPARFKQLPDDEKVYVKGKGSSIVYLIHDEELVLTGNAELSQGGNNFSSDHIVYDRIKARLKAGAAAEGKQRVHVTIQPENMR